MSKYSIIKADVNKNKKDILPILKRNLKGITDKRYDWNYKSCPYGTAKCFLGKDDKNSFVGSAALFPRKILIKGEQKSTAIAGDFAVDKKHRAFGPALAIQKTMQEETNKNLDFIYGVPNKLSQLLFERIGYIKVGIFKNHVKILKTKHMPKEYLPSFAKFKLFSILIDFYIVISAKEKRYKKKKKYSIKTPDKFDKSFDEFFKKVSKDFRIIGERNSKFLNWRYVNSPDREYKIFCIVDNKKSIQGYIVYFEMKNVCHIVDLLCKKSDETADTLFSEFFLFSRKKQIGSVTIRYLGNNFLKQKIKKFNFIKTKKPDPSLYIYKPNISSNSDLLNEENWHFLEGDNDF